MYLADIYPAGQLINMTYSHVDGSTVLDIFKIWCRPRRTFKICFTSLVINEIYK